MANVFDKIARRACMPVAVGGTMVYLKEMTYADAKRVRGVEGEDLRSGLAFALSIVDESGATAFPKIEGELDAQLAFRVNEAMDELPALAVKVISDALEKLMSQPSPETLAKN